MRGFCHAWRQFHLMLPHKPHNSQSFCQSQLYCLREGNSLFLWGYGKRRRKIQQKGTHIEIGDCHKEHANGHNSKTWPQTCVQIKWIASIALCEFQHIRMYTGQLSNAKAAHGTPLPVLTSIFVYKRHSLFWDAPHTLFPNGTWHDTSISPAKPHM